MDAATRNATEDTEGKVEASNRISCACRRYASTMKALE